MSAVTDYSGDCSGSPPPSRPPVRYGSLELESRFLLSPLAGFTNLPFRRLIRELGGVGLCTTDLVNSRGLLARNPKSLELIASCAEDRPLAVQIFGNDRRLVADAAYQLQQEHGVATVDINMGCPVAKVTNNGSGAAMMRDADETIRLVETVVRRVNVPVSVKMRLGWDSQHLTAPWFAREFEQVGVAAVAIHGRTREQGFRGTVNLDGIRQVVEAVDSIPVIGNGDIRSVPDAARMLEVTGCHGVSVGRGALANPWIFRQLGQWEQTGLFDPPGNFDDRLQLLLRQFQFLVDQKGPERAIVSFRRMAHWYLKSMRVRAGMRHRFQQVKTMEEFRQVIAEVQAEGPTSGPRSGILPTMQVPVPSGPVSRW